MKLTHTYEDNGYTKPTPSYIAFKNGDFPNLGQHIYGKELKSPTSCPDEPLVPFSKADENVFLGIELEYSNLENKLSSFTKCRKARREENCFFTYKSDGSLRSGIETTTNPFSPSFYYYKGRKYIENFIEDANGNAATTQNAGLHIHISKTVGSDVLLHLFNIINAHIQFFVAIGGRGLNSYCEEKPWKNTRLPSTNKYSTTNTQKSNTMESRFPSSSLKKEEVLGNIENIICLTRFILSGKEFTYKRYIDFANADKKAYANLIAILPKSITPTMKTRNSEYLSYFYKEDETVNLEAITKENDDFYNVNKPKRGRPKKVNQETITPSPTPECV